MNTAVYTPALATDSANLGDTPETVIAYPYSGDYRIDVLLFGATEKWEPTRAAGLTRTVTYSFAASANYLASSSDYAEDIIGLTPFTSAEKTATQKILSYVSSILPMTFVEVTETASGNSATGEIRLVNNTQEGSSGYALSPGESDLQYRGDVFLSTSSINSTYAPGSFDYDTILHELTHALGLKHPGNYNAGEAVSTDPGNYLATSEDSKTLSVVSYAEQSQGLQRIDFAPYDLLALKYLYGLKAQNVGDNTFAWTDAIGQQMQTLIDDGGTDTIDLRQLTTDNQIDLREGHSSNAGRVASSTSTPAEPALQNVQIAFGTQIENIWGSPQADHITGNSSSNTLQGNDGNDTFVGGEGVDTAVWLGPLSQYTWAATDSGWSVHSKSGTEGTDQLQQVERLRFSDQNVALDLDGNAGITAKILGAIFGRASITNTQFVGIGLHYLDSLGYTYSELMNLAIQVRVGSQATPAQIVDMLYTNLVGQAPTAATLAVYVGMLESGAQTPASLGMLAADTSLNTTNIDLMGLTSTGLPYQPLA